MTNSDKVIQARPLVRMIRQAYDFSFVLFNQNANYVSVGSTILFECRNLSDAVMMVNSLNIAINPIMNFFINDYETRIGNIIA